MSTEDTGNMTGCASAGDEEWLYGDDDDDGDNDNDVADDADGDAEVFSALVGNVEDFNGAEKQVDSESESEDNVQVTIGAIKAAGSQTSSTPVSLDLKTPARATVSGLKYVDATSSISSTPVVEGDVESFDEKPWRKPGADLSDYFNYGFNEDTWRTYCDKQRKLRISLEIMTLGCSSKYVVGRDSDCSSRKSNGSINVNGGQSESISRVEGRRRHDTDGSNAQVQPSSERSSDAELQSPKLPPFFPPNIPPPPFPPLSINTIPPLLQPPPRLSMCVPRPGFPVPPGVPSPSMMATLDRVMRYRSRKPSVHSREQKRGRSHSPTDRSSHSGRSRGNYSTPSFPFCAGVYPNLLGGVSPWPGLIEGTKPWEFFTSQDKEKDRERTRERDRDRDRDHTPSVHNHSSDEERVSRHRDQYDRERDRHRERAGRDRDRGDRHRERRHRERSDRHKSSHSSSSRRRHASNEGESHKRHRLSKRSRDSTEPKEERATERGHPSEATE